MRLFSGTPWDRPPRCERCGELEAECQCPAPAPEYLPPGEQTARLSTEKRNRGKFVTLVRGLRPTETDLPALLTHLKNSCGSGGTLKEGELEIQGRHQDQVRELLQKLGYRVKG